MTVNTTTAYKRTLGDGVTTVFDVPFPLLDASQLIVELVDTTTGIPTSQVLTTDYTVAIAADGQSADVTMLTPPPSTRWVVRRRAASLVQPNPIPAHGKFPAEVVEGGLDRLTMDLQAMRSVVDRAIALDDSDPAIGARLPALSTILNKYLYINGAGQPVGVDGPAGVAVAAALVPFVQAASLQAALELLPMPMLPQGRLTLQTGVPVMNGNVAAAGTVYYTPGIVPIYDGSGWRARALAADLSNVLANGATGNAGPAAAVPNANYDMYVWRSGGINYLTRSDYWKKANTVTMTIASPCVVSWNGHGLADGTPIVFSTTSLLPTGVVAGTTYFVKSPSTNTFNIAATVGGAAINTSGSQSGTHTGTAGDDTGATALAASGNCERQRIGGILTNKNAITNGPGVNLGTYVGTIGTDASGATVTWNTGGVDTPAVLNVWNCYNRRRVAGLVSLSADSWSYTSNIIRAANAVNTMRVSFVAGLQEEFVRAQYSQRVVGVSVNGALIGIGLDSTTAFSGRVGYIITEGSGNSGLPVHGSIESQLLGRHFMQALERGDSSAAAVFVGDGGQTFPLSGLEYQGWF